MHLLKGVITLSLTAFLGPEYELLARRIALTHISLLDFQSVENQLLKTITGSGALAPDQGKIIQVLQVSSDKTRLEPGLHNIEADPNILELVQSAIGQGVDWVREIFLHVLSPPQPQLHSGDRITAAQFGTAGPYVKWDIGEGFLTAGHVAPDKSSVMSRGKNWPRNTQIGTTRYCGYRVATGSSPMADVSVVELVSGVSFTQTFSGFVHGSPSQAIHVHSPPQGGANATIMGYLTFLHMPATNATYGNCYMTTQHVTAAGHSGSAVSDASGNSVLGIVVGGSPAFTTYIQDIDYLIKSIPQAGTGLTNLGI